MITSRTVSSATLAASAIAALLLAPGLGRAQAGPDAPTEVIAQRIVKAPFADRIEALGTLRPSEAVDITANVTERIVAVNFDDGDFVEAGQVLVEMDADEERAQVVEARSTVREAEAQFERSRELEQRGASTGRDLDERRRALETARARLAAAESRLADRQIKAPFAGRMGLRNVSVGAIVESAEPIGSLFDDRVMKLDFSVPSTFLPTLTPGLRIRATAKAFGDTVFEGQVSSLDNRIDPVTRSILVRARLPNPDGRLRAGLLMAVELFKDEREAVIAPEEALIASGGGQSVLRLIEKDGRTVAERVAVTTGGRRPGDVEVLEGLAAGDLVVTHGTLKVRPGAPVVVIAVEEGDESLPELLSQRRDAATETDAPTAPKTN